jgi:hypothetical protein
MGEVVKMAVCGYANSSSCSSTNNNDGTWTVTWTGWTSMPTSNAGAAQQSHTYRGRNASTTSSVPNSTFSVWQVNDGSGGGPDD